MKNLTAAVALISCTAFITLAQESEVVVTATRVPSPSDSVGSSVAIITAEDIARQQNNTVVDLFRQVPGVYFTQSGGPGSLGNLYVRGAETEQTLVMIDGIEINDPISPGRAAFLSNIDVAAIDRIEIIKGPQSSLYGSDALAGVVNIVTRQGTDTPGAFLAFEAGSFNTFRESAGINGKVGSTRYSFGVSRFDTDGISSANEKDGNTEEDGAEHTTLSAKLSHRFNDIFGLTGVGRYVDSEAEFDAGAGEGGDAEDNVSTRESMLGALTANIDLFDSLWRQSLRLSAADHDRRSKSSWEDTNFDSMHMKGEWQNDLYMHENHVLTLGAETQTEKGETDTIPEVSSDTFSVFAQDMITLQNLKMAIGGRWDDREDFGSELTYRVAPVYNFNMTGTRIKGSCGTGFKTPSLYQLYAPATEWGPIGNESLNPEKNRAWDIGVEQDIGDGQAVAGVTFFSTEYEDMIDFDAQGYVNRAEVETRGVEIFMDFNLTDYLMLGGHYTYLEAEDASTGEQLDRRPENRAFVELAYTQPGKTSFSVDCTYVDERSDSYYDSSMFQSVETTLEEYFLVNIAATYDITERVKLLGRVDNVFDEEYEENAGYGTPGLSAFGGVKLTL